MGWRKEDGTIPGVIDIITMAGDGKAVINRNWRYIATIKHPSFNLLSGQP